MHERAFRGGFPSVTSTTGAGILRTALTADTRSSPLKAYQHTHKLPRREVSTSNLYWRAAACIRNSQDIHLVTWNQQVAPIHHCHGLASFKEQSLLMELKKEANSETLWKLLFERVAPLRPLPRLFDLHLFCHQMLKTHNP